jgi:hypothetical protein
LEEFIVSRIAAFQEALKELPHQAQACSRTPAACRQDVGAARPASRP